MIELPKVKNEVERVNPHSMVLFGRPKTGKTTVLAALDDCLIIDVEGGSDFVSALKIDILKEAKEADELPLVTLNKLIKTISEANEKKGGYVYDKIALDTVTALEDIVLPLAAKLYRDTPMGRNWVGEDVTTLPNGAGYGYTRKALKETLAKIGEVTNTLIVVGHVKDKLVEKEGEEMEQRALDLTGKMSGILCAAVDAVGYIYRDENKTMINFATSESLLVGARCKHLIGKKIKVAESDEENNLTIDWSNIFIQ